MSQTVLTVVGHSAITLPAKKGTCYEAAALGMKPQHCICSSSLEDVGCLFLNWVLHKAQTKKARHTLTLQMLALQGEIF